MKCLFAYKWVKLPRAHLTEGKGVMGYYLRLASSAAYRPGYGLYCGYRNEVQPGTWAGGIIGLKSILGIRDRKKILATMDRLQALGYIVYFLDPATKKLTYTILDWVLERSGAACPDGAVYATEGYGFLCMPRAVTQRLIDRSYIFEEADAWLDLWCHTVWGDAHNAFSRLAPSVQFVRTSPALTLEAMGRRWGWEKTKVWRFFQKYRDTFILRKLPGAFGCLVFNIAYPIDNGPVETPSDASVKRIVDAIRFMEDKTYCSGTVHERFCKMALWYSSRINIGDLNEGCPSQYHPAEDSRVALLAPYYTRAYFSLQHCSIYQGFGCTSVRPCREANGHSPPTCLGGITP